MILTLLSDIDNQMSNDNKPVSSNRLSDTKLSHMFNLNFEILVNLTFRKNNVSYILQFTMINVKMIIYLIYLKITKCSPMIGSLNVIL